MQKERFQVLKDMPRIVLAKDTNIPMISVRDVLVFVLDTTNLGMIADLMRVVYTRTKDDKRKMRTDILSPYGRFPRIFVCKGELQKIIKEWQFISSAFATRMQKFEKTEEWKSILKTLANQQVMSDVGTEGENRIEFESVAFPLHLERAPTSSATPQTNAIVPEKRWGQRVPHDWDVTSVNADFTQLMEKLTRRDQYLSEREVLLNKREMQYESLVKELRNSEEELRQACHRILGNSSKHSTRGVHK
jgi:hypothetical protein